MSDQVFRIAEKKFQRIENNIQMFLIYDWCKLGLNEETKPAAGDTVNFIATFSGKTVTRMVSYVEAVSEYRDCLSLLPIYKDEPCHPIC